MQMPCGKILRQIFLIYAVPESAAAHLKFKTAPFKQGMTRLKFATPHSLLQTPRGSEPRPVASLEWLISSKECLVCSLQRLIPCCKRLAAPGRDPFQVWNDSFQATNASFEVCNASFFAANASQLRAATCCKFEMAHFKQGMPCLKFAMPHSLLQTPRGSEPRPVASLEWLIGVKRAASPPHLRHHNDPRCARMICMKRSAAAECWFFWHAVEKIDSRTG